MATNPNRDDREHIKKTRFEKAKKAFRKYTIPTTLALGTIFGGATANYHYIQADERVKDAIVANDYEAIDHYTDRVLRADKMMELYHYAAEQQNYRAVNAIFKSDEGHWEETFREFLDINDAEPDDVLNDNRRAFYERIIARGDFEFLGNFSIPQSMLGEIIHNHGTENVKLYAQKHASDFRFIHSIDRIVSEMISAERTHNMEEYVLWHLDNFDVEMQIKSELITLLNEAGYSELSQAIIDQSPQKNEGMNLAMARHHASEGNLNAMIDASMKAEITSDSDLLDMAVRTYIAGHNDTALDFMEHFNLDRTSFVNRAIETTLGAQNVERTHSLISEYIDLDRIALSNIFRHNREDREFKYELAKRVGVDLTPELQELLISKFSGTMDDNLRAIWAEANSVTDKVEASMKWLESIDDFVVDFVPSVTAPKP